MELLTADATSLPFDSQVFDIVVSFSTIDHIPGADHRAQAVKEISRVTKYGGYVIITVPNAIYSYIRGGGRDVFDSPKFGYEHSFFPWELRRILVSAALSPLRFVSTSGAFNRFRKPLNYFGIRMGYLAKKEG